MNFKTLVSILAITALTSPIAFASQWPETAPGDILAVINSYRPGSTGYGEMKVEEVIINPTHHTITVKCNEATAYLPLTAETMVALKNDIRAALGSKYNGYKVTLTANGQDLDTLVRFAVTDYYRPDMTQQRSPVMPERPFSAHDGLANTNIALWQSHGWYFEPKLNRWEWQRARVQQTVEDLYTQSFVMPYLMPMLENAGAYVMSPRERDTSLFEAIVDADNAATPGYSEHNGRYKWNDAGIAGFAWDGTPLINGSHPHSTGTARAVKTVSDPAKASHASWNTPIPETAPYAVYVSYPAQKNAGTVTYTIHTAGGDRHVKVNQAMGAGTWLYLGHYILPQGDNVEVITLDNTGADGQTVVADAVKIGGGTSVVDRIVKEPLDSIDYQYVGTSYPKFTQGARYFLQWAGAPDSVFTPSDYVNDYTDDYRCRGLWVNWLAGGSDMLPGREGLGIPVDLSFAFHSDAGTFKDDSIVGTLGIYCTAGDRYANGTDRGVSRDLTDLVMTDIVNDVRAGFEPNWTRRGMWDKSYFEARVPEVPAMLLELLSHQNFADMKYGIDPAFRFVVSRAIYKGMLKFLAHRDGRPYVVQPLPVKDFAITGSDGSYRLSWAARPDTLESSAMPTHYIIEERKGDDKVFSFLAQVEDTSFDITISDRDIHSYRITAVNTGGASFPSEILALCDMPGTEQVLIVNGFTRVSAPDSFEAGDIAGFYDQRDHGVPYINDISFIGSQFEFRRDIPWMDDDAAGFGASRANYETEVIAGNTFDFVYTHGRAIAAADHGFISTSVGAYMSSDVAHPRIVDLILGKQKEIKRGRGIYPAEYKTFPAALQARIEAATATGTSFLITGAFVATDLWDNPFSDEATAAADQKFATDVLGYHWRVGQASVTGEAYEVPTRFKEFTGGEFRFSNTLNSESYIVESPDSFYPADASRGCTLMRYGENNLVAGIAAAFDNYRTVVIGFPFESITNSGDRDSLMSQILNFLSK